MNTAHSDTSQNSRMTPEAKAKLRKVMRGTENGSDKGLRGALLLACFTQRAQRKRRAQRKICFLSAAKRPRSEQRYCK